MKKQKLKGTLSFKKSIISKLNADSIQGGSRGCTQTICATDCCGGGGTNEATCGGPGCQITNQHESECCQ